MREDDIANVREYCAVSKERAIELLDAASGLVHRAVEIHLQQNRRLPADNVVEIDEESSDERREVAQDGSSGKDPLPTKNRRVKISTICKTASPKPGAKQGTLHSFLGKTPKKNQSTSKVSSTRAKPAPQTKTIDWNSLPKVSARLKVSQLMHELLHRQPGTKGASGKPKPWFLERLGENSIWSTSPEASTIVVSNAARVSSTLTVAHLTHELMSRRGCATKGLSSKSKPDLLKLVGEGSIWTTAPLGTVAKPIANKNTFYKSKEPHVSLLRCGESDEDGKEEKLLGFQRRKQRVIVHEKCARFTIVVDTSPDQPSKNLKAKKRASQLKDGASIVRKRARTVKESIGRRLRRVDHDLDLQDEDSETVFHECLDDNLLDEEDGEFEDAREKADME